MLDVDVLCAQFEVCSLSLSLTDHDSVQGGFPLRSGLGATKAPDKLVSAWQCATCEELSNVSIGGHQ